MTCRTWEYVNPLRDPPALPVRQQRLDGSGSLKGMISRMFDLQGQFLSSFKRHAHSESESVSLSGLISKPTEIPISTSIMLFVQHRAAHIIKTFIMTEGYSISKGERV